MEKLFHDIGYLDMASFSVNSVAGIDHEANE